MTSAAQEEAYVYLIDLERNNYDVVSVYSAGGKSTQEPLQTYLYGKNE